MSAVELGDPDRQVARLAIEISMCRTYALLAGQLLRDDPDEQLGLLLDHLRLSVSRARRAHRLASTRGWYPGRGPDPEALAVGVRMRLHHTGPCPSCGRTLTTEGES